MTPPGELEARAVEPFDQAVPADVAQYLATMDSVPGWFHPLDASIFTAVDRIQQSHGIGGDLLEIGAYRGKSAILLGYLLRANERLVVCDIFDASDRKGDGSVRERVTFYRDLEQREFCTHYLRFHLTLPEIIAAPSTEIDRASLAGSFRLVHVDGSHSYEDVRADIETAHEVLGPGGVVIFDDWMNPNAPGVALAVWEEYLHGRLTPLCVTNLKLYATWDADGVTAVDLDAWAVTQHDIEVSSPISLGGRSVSLYLQRRVKQENRSSEPVQRAEARPTMQPAHAWRRAVRAILPPVAVTAYRKIRRRGGRRGRLPSRRSRARMRDYEG